MRSTLLAALGLAAYLVFLAVLVPASFVASRLEAQAPGALEIIEPAGTLWRGQARVRLTPAGGAPVELEHVEWQLVPRALAAGRLAFALKASGAGVDATLEAARGVSKWEVRELSARGSAATLSAAFPLLAAWRPEGAFALRAPALSWDGRELLGEARLEWQGAALALSPVRPLGTYRLEVRSEGGPAKLVVSTLDGPLKVAGLGTLSLPSNLAFSGEARAEGEAMKSLEPLLNLLGPRRADGARSLEWRH